MPASNTAIDTTKRTHSTRSDTSTSSDTSGDRSRRRRLHLPSFLASRFPRRDTPMAESEDDIELSELFSPTGPLLTLWNDGPASIEVPGAPRMEEAMDLSSSPSSVGGAAYASNIDEVANPAANQARWRQKEVEADAQVMKSLTSEVSYRDVRDHLHPHDFTHNGSCIPRPAATLTPRRYIRAAGITSQPTESYSQERPQEPYPPREGNNSALASSSKSGKQRATQLPLQGEEIDAMHGMRTGASERHGRSQDAATEIRTLWQGTT